MTKKVGADISVRWICPHCESKLYAVESEGHKLICVCRRCGFEQVVMEITQDAITRLKLC